MTRIIAALLLYVGLASAALAQTFTMPPPAGITIMGCVYNTTPPTWTTGQVGYVQCSNNGTLLGSGGGGGGGAVTIASGADVVEGSTSDAAGASTVLGQLKSMVAAVQAPLTGVTTAQTSAAASSLVAKASAGSVISVSGAAVSGSYIMVFNATSAPADGAVTPLKCYGPMAAAGPFIIPWGVGPVLAMSTGITVVSSSTGCFTKTATNANFMSVEYQ